jgi:ketosteroid isomerase-like protein
MMSGQENTRNEADLLAINRVREAHIASLNQGNVDALVGVFSEDAVQMPPNTPANVGREMIRAWSKAFLDPLRAEFAHEVEEIRVAGDWAFERGTYRIRVTPKAGGESFQDTASTSRSTKSSPTVPGSWPATSGTAITLLRVRGRRKPPHRPTWKSGYGWRRSTRLRF